MMVRTGNLKSLAAALLLLTAASLSAQIRYQATPGSTVKLDGTSTVHDWTVEGKIIGGFVEFESEEALDPAKTASDV